MSFGILIYEFWNTFFRVLFMSFWNKKYEFYFVFS